MDCLMITVKVFPSDDVICDLALLCGRLPAALYSTGAAVMSNHSLRENVTLMYVCVVLCL